MKRLVLKIGGSCLSNPGIVPAVRRWIEELDGGAQVLMLVGGGEVVEAMRHYASIHELDVTRMHWRCIDALNVTFDLAKELWPEAIPIEKGSELRNVDDARVATYLVSCDAFYSRRQPSPLPETWATTTDSLAAWLAKIVLADQLVLLKSCRVDADLTVCEAIQEGIVDDAFDMASQGLAVTWLSLEDLVTQTSVRNTLKT